MSVERRKIDMRFPVPLLERIDRRVGGRGRTEWLVQAAEEKLVREATVMGLFRCPQPDCAFRSDSSTDLCSTHGSIVVPTGGRSG